MANTSDIRNGLCMRYNNDIFTVTEFLHVKPGKGAAFVRTKLKSLTTGKVIDNTFNAGVKIDAVRVERRTYQYLYNDEQGYHFMNQDDFEQIFLDGKILENADLMKEGILVEILFNAEDESPLTCDLPPKIELEVTYTEPGIKGDTATNSLKPATLETGAEIRVPLFINTGDFVRVDSSNRAYIERVKK